MPPKGQSKGGRARSACTSTTHQVRGVAICTTHQIRVVAICTADGIAYETHVFASKTFDHDGVVEASQILRV